MEIIDLTLTPVRVRGAREPRCLVPDVREFIFEKETDENSQRSASPQLPADTRCARGSAAAGHPFPPRQQDVKRV